MSYGGSDRDLFRSTTSYVDRILKGATPADFTVQPPTSFELVVMRSRRAAAHRGAAVAPVPADEVIGSTWAGAIGCWPARWA